MTRAMVLAAGVGSRLEPISHFIPKPLAPVLNTPVLVNILHGLKMHGVTDVISNTHYLSEMLIEYFEKNSIDLKPKFVYEEELTGDAGGVRTCRDFLDSDTFLVIMGDLITNADLTKIIKEHKEKGAIATIGVKKVSDVTRFGVMKRDQQGFIQAFQEKPKAEEAISNEISTGIYVLEPKVFDHIPKDGVYGFGRQLFPSLVERGLPVLGAEIQGHWSDIGTLQDLFRSNMDALNGKIKLFTEAKYCEKTFDNVSISKKTAIGTNTNIGQNSVIGDECIIGNNCEIGSNVHLDHCLIFADSKIPDGTKLQNCIYAFEQLIPMAAIAQASKGPS